MADFLKGITQRTLGLLPVVQPISASTYVTEAMGAAGALTLRDPCPGSLESEPYEQWEEPEERLPPAALPQPPLPRRGAPAPTPAVPGASASIASPGEQPSTAPAQQASPSPVKLQAAPAVRESTGGNPPAPLVPQSQPSPARGENLPLVSRPPADKRSPERKDAPADASSSPEVVSPQSQIGDAQENPSFPTPSAGPAIPTGKRRRGPDKPAGSQQQGEYGALSTSDPLSRHGTPSARSQQSAGNTPLVPAQPGAIAATSQLPPAGVRAIPSNKKKSGEQQQASPTLLSEGSSFESASPMPIPSSLPMPTSTSNTPSINRRTIARARQEGSETLLVPEPEGPGRGQAREASPAPQSYTKNSASAPYRVGAGLVPALVSPVLVSSSQSTASDQVEPLLPPAYTPIQSRRMESPAAGKRAETQRAEPPAPPTIRVTIGRIEVRAVTPAPPVAPAPVRTPRAAPALSLEDYLKQRNGGQL